MKFIKKPSTAVVKPVAWNHWGDVANEAKGRPLSDTVTSILQCTAKVTGSQTQ